MHLSETLDQSIGIKWECLDQTEILRETVNMSPGLSLIYGRLLQFKPHIINERVRNDYEETKCICIGAV